MSNNVKCIAFDLDGVIFEWNLDKLRQIRALRYPNLDGTIVDAFFKQDMRDCIMKKKDTVATMTPYLKRAGWEGSGMDYIRFWHAADHCIVFPVLDLVKQYRDKGIHISTFTDQEPYRWEYIKNVMKLDQHFDTMIAGCDLQAHKPTHKFMYGWFQKISQIIPNIQKDQILVIDDSKKNVDAAHEFGYQAHHFVDYEWLVEYLETAFK